MRTLDRYAAETLANPPALAREGGVHILAEPRRGLPHWKGFTLPILGLSYPTGALVTVRPDWLQPLLAELGSDARLPSLADGS